MEPVAGGLVVQQGDHAKAGFNPDDPPKTIDQLMADMAAIKKSAADRHSDRPGHHQPAVRLICNWPWMQTFGANPMANGGKGAETPAMRAYLTWMRELAQNGYTNPGLKIGEFRPLAAQDKVAFGWDRCCCKASSRASTTCRTTDFYQHWGVTTLPVGAIRQGVIRSMAVISW